MKKTFLLLGSAIFLAGCSSAQRTHIAWLDSTYQPPQKPHELIPESDNQRLLSQPPRTNVEVFHQDHMPDRPYREVAFFSVDGNGNQEADAIQGFVDLARHAGADALIVTLPSNAQVSNEPTPVLMANQRYIFHATAIVWKDKPAPGSPVEAK